VLAADHGGAPVALFPMSQREAVLPAKLSGPGARPTVAAEIAEGMRAYTIKVSDVSGVGGHALPGDHVDVVLMRDLTPGGDQRNYISYVVLQNVRVLGVDLNADLKSEKPASPSTATLEVSVEDAQKLSVASTLGTLSLALRRTGAAELDEAPPMRTADFLVGGNPRSTVRTVASAAPSGAPRPAYSAILIVEGEGMKRPRPARKPVVTAPPPTLNGTTASSTPASTQGANG
jgi:pilus assembly protein CpaB